MLLLLQLLPLQLLLQLLLLSCTLLLLLLLPLQLLPQLLLLTSRGRTTAIMTISPAIRLAPSYCCDS